MVLCSTDWISYTDVGYDYREVLKLNDRFCFCKDWFDHFNLPDSTKMVRVHLYKRKVPDSRTIYINRIHGRGDIYSLWRWSWEKGQSPFKTGDMYMYWYVQVRLEKAIKKTNKWYKYYVKVEWR